MKAVLMSIQPKWCELIASGKKTVEVRKNKPKLEAPFKVYIYCTKAKDHFSIGGGIYATSDTLYRLPTGEIKFGDGFELMGDWSGQYDENNFLNGKVVGEFVCDTFITDKTFGHDALFNAAACLSDADAASYCVNKETYGWHITDLVIYDKPRGLSEFKTFCKSYYDGKRCDDCKYFIDGRGYEYDESDCGCNGLKPITRPPQSWCYVEEVE